MSKSQRAELSSDLAVLRPLVMPAGLCRDTNRNNLLVIGVHGCFQHLAQVRLNAHNLRIARCHLGFVVMPRLGANQCKQGMVVVGWFKSHAMHGSAIK